MRKFMYMLLISTLLFSGCSIIQSDNQKDINDANKRKEIKLIKDWEIDKISENFRPTIDNNDAFALTTQFNCIDSYTGKVRWSTFLLGNLIDVIYLNNDSLAIVGGNKLNCLDRKTGDLIWEFNTLEEILSAPVEKDGIIYFTASEGVLYAVDLISGKEIWNFKIDNNSTSMQYLSNPVIVDNTILLSSGLYNTLYAMDIVSHNEIWRFENLDNHNANLFSDGTNAYLVNGNGSIYAFDISNADIKWGIGLDTSINSNCTIMYGYIYLYSDENHIFCIDLETGNIDFEYNFEGEYGIGDICVTEDIIYFTTYEGLASIDLNGNNFKLYELASCLAKKIVLNANEAYITTTNNKLIKYLISD